MQRACGAIAIIPCQVIAPSFIPNRSRDRVKTDRRDGLRLAELASAGEMRAVWMPDPADEATRDLAPAPEEAPVCLAQLQAADQHVDYVFAVG